MFHMVQMYKHTFISFILDSHTKDLHYTFFWVHHSC